ncbi:MAG: adenylate/guanylate cyclase domain-containing protein [Melioribacteraceae bacterium]|nr:adenylate/guanylate cyclase domain-containing protein [Melioribacteraceae bacterium]
METGSLNNQLRREILQSERLRAILLSTVSVISIIILFSVNQIFSEEIERYLKRGEFIYIIVLILFLFLLRELAIIRYIDKKLKAGENVGNRIRYITNFIEVSIPSIILLSIGFFLETTEVLVSPVLFFYFIFIILSTLSLEFKISVSIGVIAAIEYLAVFIILNERFGDSSGKIVFNSLLFHIGKANLLIVGGVVSGFVANQIKRKLLRINKTLIERNKIVNMFGQQVSAGIVDHLLEKGDEIKSERKYVCIMFLDIRGFSKLAENKEPEEIIKFQNNTFGFMIEIINKYNGVINQFLGDGYMATFGAPISSENDCQNAVNASLEILSELEKKNRSGSLPNIKIGIGLHAGYVVAGNVGTDTRKQYSISGNTVIIASRIEQLNKSYNSSLLVSREVLDRVAISSEDTICHGLVGIKGREKPIEIFQLNLTKE